MTAQDRLLGGRYQVGELLGYGGMAEVHRGRDLRLGRDVAIKMLRVDLARDATFQARFRREAQNAASLNHPAIVSVYDTGEERGKDGESLPYIVMEYVNGRTLKEVLATEGPLMPRRALEIVADICSALDFSHRHGIIHRDIKPGNVMLTTSGQVKVMDFGIARALTSATSTMTATSAVIGTAQYLSPEQARGESVDARSDVYATGCVLYELLCGHPPFTGDNPVSVAYQHVREDPRPVSELNPDVTPEIDAVVLKALAKNPANRYQSAAEMRADALRAAAGRPVTATPVMSAEERTRYIPTTGGNRRDNAPTARVADAGGGQRRMASWALMGLALVAVFGLVVFLVGQYLANQNRNVQVPDVQGRPFPEAQDMLQQHGLYAERQDAHSEGCDPETVISTSPAPSATVERGSTVAVIVCLGPNQVTVPANLVGMQQEEAEQALREANLTPSVVTVNSARPAGEVLEVSPPSGTQVDVGSEVTLTVSLGNRIDVPYVVGQSRDSAISRLVDAGVDRDDISIEYRPAENGERPGRVVAQNVTGEQPIGVRVRLTVAIAPDDHPTDGGHGEPTTNPTGGTEPSHSPTPSSAPTQSEDPDPGD